jgi:hypothetical protein
MCRGMLVRVGNAAINSQKLGLFGPHWFRPRSSMDTAIINRQGNLQPLCLTKARFGERLLVYG